MILLKTHNLHYHIHNYNNVNHALIIVTKITKIFLQPYWMKIG